MSGKPQKVQWFILKEERQQNYLLRWYRQLHGLNEKDELDGLVAMNRGARAELKRCHTVGEIMLCRSFFDLSRGLPELDRYHLEGLAIAAVALALTAVPTRDHLPAILGKAKEETKTPRFSELRFQRLLASNTPNAFLRSLRRAVVQADKKADPLRLADSILHWESEQRNPDWYTGRRRWQYQWAKDYYAEVFKYEKAA